MEGTSRTLWAALTWPFFILMLPVSFVTTLLVLFHIYPDAGPGAMVFFVIAPVVALPAAGILAILYRLLVRWRWWGGIPLLVVGALLMVPTVRVLFVPDPEVEQALRTTCVAEDPRPGQDVSNCAVYYTLPADRNPARSLFASYGWSVGDGRSHPTRAPSSFGALWRLRGAFSADVGLQFRLQPGDEVVLLDFPVTGTKELPGPNGPCRTRGGAALHPNGTLLGAWVECLGPAGGPSRAVPGYSLRGRSAEEVTGTSWSWYRLRYDW